MQIWWLKLAIKTVILCGCLRLLREQQRNTTLTLSNWTFLAKPDHHTKTKLSKIAQFSKLHLLHFELYLSVRDTLVFLRLFETIFFILLVSYNVITFYKSNLSAFMYWEQLWSNLKLLCTLSIIFWSKRNCKFESSVSRAISSGLSRHGWFETHPWHFTFLPSYKARQLPKQPKSIWFESQLP